MIVEMTREFVIKSLSAEANVKSGFGWIDRLGGTPAKDCPVCAVGAVMRAALARPTAEGVAELSQFVSSREFENADGSVFVSTSGSVYSTEADLFEYASKRVQKQPFRTLSCVFESLTSIRSRGGSCPGSRLSSWDQAVVRSRTIFFVGNYFPDTVLADVNGFLPAEDVRIVSE